MQEEKKEEEEKEEPEGEEAEGTGGVEEAEAQITTTTNNSCH